MSIASWKLEGSARAVNYPPEGRLAAPSSGRASAALERWFRMTKRTTPTPPLLFRVLAVHIGSHLFWALLFAVAVATGGSTIGFVAFYDAFVLGFLGPSWPLIGGFLVFTLTGTLCGIVIAAGDPERRQVIPAALASLIPTYAVLCIVRFLFQVR